MKKYCILPKGERWRRGDIHPFTGKVFWQYTSACKDGEYWVSPEKFESNTSYHADYRAKNPEVFLKSQRSFAERNREKLRAEYREYRKNNWGKIIAHQSLRNKTDPVYSMAHRCRRRIRATVAGRCKMSRRSEEIMGCKWDVLRSHIESKFTEGMSWDNISEWQIDHIIPLASANTVEDVIRLCHYTNLQPLWPKDNILKGHKMPHGTPE
jgi:hypothetical protein